MSHPADVGTIRAWAELRRGDLIDIDGRTERGGFAPNIRPATVRSSAAGRCRGPERVLSAMLTGRHDCDYVEIVGVIQRAWLSSDPAHAVMFADVATDDGVVRASFWDYTPADLTRFIDARVRLRGNVGTIFGQTEQLRGVSLFVGRIRDIACSNRRPIRSPCRRAPFAASTTTRPPAR